MSKDGVGKKAKQVIAQKVDGASIRIVAKPEPNGDSSADVPDKDFKNGDASIDEPDKDLKKSAFIEPTILTRDAVDSKDNSSEIAAASSVSPPNPASSALPALRPRRSFFQLLRELLDPNDILVKYINTNLVDYVKYIWSLRAPLLLLLAVAVVPKVIILWIVVVLLKPVCTWLYRRTPAEWQQRIAQNIPPQIKSLGLIRDFSEGADQCLPFILFWLYLCCAPFAVLWIGAHWIRGFLPHRPAKCENGFVFAQNSKRDLAQPENNFYYSRAFGITVFAFFALGFPALFSYTIYQKLGIDQQLKTAPATELYLQKRTSLPPVQHRPKFIGGYRGHRVWPASNQPSTEEDADRDTVPTFVTGYNGFWPWLWSFQSRVTERNVFFIHFYLVSLGCAMSVLFFRAWFFFPLNFLSDQHDVYLTPRGVRRTTMKNWFLNVLTVNRWAIGGGPDSLDWSEIKSLAHVEEGFTRLSPLPETAFKKESLAYKLLNKLASFVDGLSNKVNTGNYLIFSTTEKEGDFGRNIKINLNDLNREQRAKLFYSVKSWAPHVVIKQNAQELLLGSVVLQDVRYTQLWFDLLTAKTKVRRQSVLTPGEVLHEGAYTIEERLSSGGQATAYLAKTKSNQQVVLKEFILAIASTPGALIESAREFETEVSLLSQLNHPGIVKLEDFFTEDGRVYVVLEYVPGQTLRTKIQEQGALSNDEAIALSSKICEVLEYLHKFDPPIVHRDITPENILIAPDGSIKLIDFSLAVKTDGNSTTDSCGKQAFTPPEQFRDEVCPASDIYGLGATMYFMLTGVPPKPITPSSPQKKTPSVSDKLNKIVERATQLDLNQRYDSIHWLKLDLTDATNSDSSSQTDSKS